MDVENKRSEQVKRARRRIEDKIRKDFSDEKILGLAALLDIPTTPQDSKKD